MIKSLSLSIPDSSLKQLSEYESIDLIKLQYYNPRSDFNFNNVIEKEFNKNG